MLLLNLPFLPTLPIPPFLPTVFPLHGLHENLRQRGLDEFEAVDVRHLGQRALEDLAAGDIFEQPEFGAVVAAAQDADAFLLL